MTSNFKKIAQGPGTDTQKGFTLIELLIVIVIIGLLAGVLIALIDPIAQQNRARDAGVQAALNKTALSAEGFISAYGEAPTGAQFIGSLKNVTELGTSCGSGDTCDFAVTGNVLDLTCSNSWSGNGSSQCSFHYERVNFDGDAQGIYEGFNIYAKSFGIADTIFKLTSIDAQIHQCPGNAVNAGASGC